MNRSNQPFVGKAEGLFLNSYFDYKYQSADKNIKGLRLIDYNVENLKTHNSDIFDSTFSTSSFRNCTFDQTNFYRCRLLDVTFLNCYFSRINYFDSVHLDSYNKFQGTSGGMLRFNKSYINNINFIDSVFQNITFLQSKIKTFALKNSKIDRLEIKNSTIDKYIVDNSSVNSIEDNSTLQLNKMKLAKEGLKCSSCGKMYNLVFNLFNKQYG